MEMPRNLKMAQTWRGATRLSPRSCSWEILPVGTKACRETQQPLLFCDFRGPSYPSTKFLNGAHGEIAYSHLNNLKMAEEILLKLSPRIPLRRQAVPGKFQP